MTEKKKTNEKKEAKALQKELDKLKIKYEKIEAENTDLLEKLQRVSADYANYQKRAPKQITESIAYEKETIVKSILPVMDNFEHTLSHAGTAENVEAVTKGVQIIYDQMLDIMKSLNVEQIVALGEKFDPASHQAMMQRPEPDKEDGIILEEFQKGYRLNDRVIRPSRVIVNKLPAEPSEDQGDEDSL